MEFELFACISTNLWASARSFLILFSSSRIITSSLTVAKWLVLSLEGCWPTATTKAVAGFLTFAGANLPMLSRSANFFLCSCSLPPSQGPKSTVKAMGLGEGHDSLVCLSSSLSAIIVHCLTLLMSIFGRCDTHKSLPGLTSFLLQDCTN